MNRGQTSHLQQAIEIGCYYYLTNILVKRQGLNWMNLGEGVLQCTFTVVIGFDGNVGVLDDADESESPEHDAVDAQIVVLGWGLERH